MARWFAIVALLLGLGFTAYESFSPSIDHSTPVRTMEGGTGIPPIKLKTGS
jgi:hypothetical protein